MSQKTAKNEEVLVQSLPRCCLTEWGRKNLRPSVVATMVSNKK